MRILVLNYEYPPIGGGSSPVTHEIAKRYVKRGHEVSVVTALYGDLPREEVVDGIRVYRLKCLRKRKELSRVHELVSFLLAAIVFFHQHLKTQRYDVCHVHFIVPTGLLALYLKLRFGLPYVLTAHGSDVPGYNSDRFTWLHRILPPMLRRVCDNASVVVSPSKALAQLIRHSIRDYSAERLIKIPNGIDPGTYLPLEKKNIILATGRLLPRKGFQHLIKAVSREDIGFEVHICGDGPKASALRKLAAKSRTPIHFHGWLDANSDLYRKLLGCAAIYALPSCSENASISLLEAMSAGCAVITSNAAGCPETVGSSGILIKPKDPDQMREALSLLIRDRRLRQQLQEEARLRVETVYDWERIVETYEAMLQSAASLKTRDQTPEECAFENNKPQEVGLGKPDLSSAAQEDSSLLNESPNPVIVKVGNLAG